MARQQRTAHKGRRTTIYLTPLEEYALDTIQKLRRQKPKTKAGQKDSPSEIVADALWHYLEKVHKIRREELENVLRKR